MARIHEMDTDEIRLDGECEPEWEEPTDRIWMTTHADQRKWPRIGAQLAVVAQAGDEQFTCISLDLSEWGVGLETDSPPPVGTLVELGITLPGVAKAELTEGRVCWIRERKGNRAGACGVALRKRIPPARLQVFA